MQNFPPIDLLEATHQFPGTYTFKVIAYSDVDIVERTLQAVKKSVLYDVQIVHSVRKSVGGKHVAITLDVAVRTAYDVHDIYRALYAIDGIVLLF